MPRLVEVETAPAPVPVVTTATGPYWRSDCGRYEVWCGDCRDVMVGMPAESVRLLWTDPPYGHGNHDNDFNARLNNHRGLEQQPIMNDTPDSMREVVSAMLVHAVRVLKPDCCCCCCCCGGGGPRPTFAWVAHRMDEKGLTFFHSVIWDKRNPGLGWRYRRQHEMVMVAHRTGGQLAWRDDDAAVPNIYSLMPPMERNHPNEKPVEMVKWFVENHTRVDDMVLDPFMGSGTTGVACVELGRRFVGVELSLDYCKVAVGRIQRAMMERGQMRRPPIESASEATPLRRRA